MEIGEDTFEPEKETIKLNARQFEIFSKPPQEQASNVIEELIDKIGVGKYQYLVYLVIGIAWLTDGCEVMTISMTNYIFTKLVWFVSESDIAQMGSLLFTGFFLGSSLAGLISDKYGRKRPVLVYMALMFVTCAASALSNTFGFLLFTRGLFGVVVGLLGPTSSSMLTEITSRAKRGVNYILISALFSVGEIMAVFTASILEVDLPGSQAWRGLLFWSAFPAICGAILGYFALYESPRYMMQVNKEKGIQILKQMYHMNKKAPLYLTESNNFEINEWTKSNLGKHEKLQLNAVLKKGMRKITIPLWIAWWVLSFAYYGIIYELPKTLTIINQESTQKEAEGINYKDLYISILAEIPGYFIAVLMIEHPFLGRRRSLVISFGLSGIALVCSYLFPSSSFLYFILISKLMSNLAFCFIGPYTTELYPTNCRATGYGLASAASRIGGAMMPWIAYMAEGISVTAPYLFFGISCLMAAIACYLIPYDTVGKALDEIEEDNKN